MKPKVFVSRPLFPEVVARLRERCEVEMHPEDEPLKPPAMAEKCREAEGLMTVGTRVNEDVLKAAPKLRVVANAGVGYDNIDVAACTARRIVVTNTPGVLTDTTADLAFALLVAVARRVVECDRYVREGRWHRWGWTMLWSADVHHQTLGLYGFGRIGRAMARRGRGFGMRVLYHQRRRAPEEMEKEVGAELVDRETLLRESDFLSLHVPLTPETHHAIGTREFGLMKSTAFLINTARGKVVDEEALVAALSEGRIAGAGLDVFEHEPHVHPKLLEMPNVVLTPHLGSATAATRFKMASLAAENLLAALEGRRPPNAVNPEVFD